MDDDLLSLDIDTQPANPPRRRRTPGTTTPSTGNLLEESSPFAEIRGSSPVPQSTRPRRLATWADEANESLQHLQSLNASERPKTQTKNNQIDSDQDTIPIIPDLEEVRDEEFVQQVASAPSVQMNKLASFNELNKDLMKHAAFSSLDGIDLTPLTQFCLPESQVKEDDVSWNWDYLISDVTSKLHLDSDSNKLDSH